MLNGIFTYDQIKDIDKKGTFSRKNMRLEDGFVQIYSGDNAFVKKLKTLSNKKDGTFNPKSNAYKRVTDLKQVYRNKRHDRNHPEVKTMKNVTAKRELDEYNIYKTPKKIAYGFIVPPINDQKGNIILGNGTGAASDAAGASASASGKRSAGKRKRGLLLLPPLALASLLTLLLPRAMGSVKRGLLLLPPLALGSVRRRKSLFVSMKKEP